MRLTANGSPLSGIPPQIGEAGSCTDKDKGALVVPELSIICVNWNSLSYLVDCIASIYKHTSHICFELIVVDNASPESGIESIANRFPQVTIVKSDINLGFAGANNLGFTRSTGHHILLLNPDTELLGPAIETMLDQIKSLPDAGIVGCKLLNTDLSISTCSIQKFPTIVNQLLNIELLRLRFPGFPLWNLRALFSTDSRPVQVDVIPGACMMLKRDVFEKVGLLSEDYFMYGEDIDLNYKVRRLGFRSYYIGQAEIVHHGGRSSSQQALSFWSIAMTFRAMLIFYRKSRGPAYAAAYRVAMGISACVRLALLAVSFPFGDKTAVRYALAKWRTVLNCSIRKQAL